MSAGSTANLPELTPLSFFCLRLALHERPSTGKAELSKLHDQVPTPCKSKADLPHGSVTTGTPLWRDLWDNDPSQPKDKAKFVRSVDGSPKALTLDWESSPRQKIWTRPSRFLDATCDRNHHPR